MARGEIGQVMRHEPRAEPFRYAHPQHAGQAVGIVVGRHDPRRRLPHRLHRDQQRLPRCGQHLSLARLLEQRLAERAFQPSQVPRQRRRIDPCRSRRTRDLAGAGDA